MEAHQGAGNGQAGLEQVGADSGAGGEVKTQQEKLAIPGAVAGIAEPELHGSDWITENTDRFFRSSEDVVRRHSISLTNRTPPRTSIAADILASSKPFQNTKLAVDELKDLTEKLSDFNSCISDSEGSTSSKVEETDGEKSASWKSMNEKKRYKKNKRKNSTTPNKDQFLKKSVLESSPL